MKLQFDPNQQFQLDAVASITDLFEGQPQGEPEFNQINLGDFGNLFVGQSRTELGMGNQNLLDEDKLRANTRLVQARSDIEISNPLAPLEAWEIYDAPSNCTRICPHFSVEMETGTGKTYVYLRTIFELSQRYGFQKFIIVVPSVAIREGVRKNLEITAEHFKNLYNLQPEFYLYDAKRISRLRDFAVKNTLQVLIINIDAFRKNFSGTESEQKSNVIYKESDRLSGRPPIEFVQAARPIVIVDEPQSVDNTEKAQEAIKALNPLCTLRYSATHTNPYNLVYRLDPVRAFELKLVKQIIVASAGVEGGANSAFVRVEAIEYKTGIKARLRIHVQSANGPKEKVVTVKSGSDLFTLSNERPVYQNGFIVSEINAEPGSETIQFNSGMVLGLGEETGGMREEVWRVQIRQTVKRHLEKELQVGTRGIKVLSLFFIDRVANYRDYAQDGKAIKGKFAFALEETLKEFAREPRYAGLDWLKQTAEKLHNGYFAQDKKGILKDTRGDSQADDDAYQLIMQDKERLLSLDEPLRFIFSHSALREGWDNPNVFQICNLREMSTERERRQTLGRGLRLPVNQEGVRVRDDSINKLYVFANETYEEFARELQKEYEQDCGVTFGKVPFSAFSRLTQVVNGEEKPIGGENATTLRKALQYQNILDADGRIQSGFNPRQSDFRLELPARFSDLAPAVVDLLSAYQIERHIRREDQEGRNKLRKEVQLSPEFIALWEKIKSRTTYRVEFSTDELVRHAVKALMRMEQIEAPKIRVSAGQMSVTHNGVIAKSMRVSEETMSYHTLPVPDLLAYLQNETELTRSTLVRILKESGRLDELFIDPQRFMDGVAGILKAELHRLLVDGIKYERIAGDNADSEWEMVLFKNEELINYLNAQQVNKSIYEYVVYDSDIERQFACKLDQREDIRLFVKLPAWFLIDTPVGKYNPDWVIIKQDNETMYLVRETKGTRDLLQLRSVEADKIRCGMKHFEELGVSFNVVTHADEV